MKKYSIVTAFSPFFPTIKEQQNSVRDVEENTKELTWSSTRMPKIQNRQKAIQMALPDALDLLIICVDAGLSMEAALHRVAKELQYQGPELSEELGLATAELAFLTDRRQAMLNLSERTGLPAIKALVTAMVQAERYGTAIGVSLRVLSEEQRDERMSRAEQKAGALPAQLTVPMIVFFLPVLFVVLLGPAIIKVLDTI